MYRVQFRDSETQFLLGDVHQLDLALIPDATMATASFPCNDLSLAGPRTGLDGKQSSAYWGFLRILDGMKHRRPPIVLLENVSGFLTSHRGEDFKKALLALNKLGYSVDSFMIDAARFLPQSRIRLFVVGSLQNSYGTLAVSETPTFFESEARPRALANFIFAHPEISWNVRKLPSLPCRTLSLENILEDLPSYSSHWWNQERTEYLIGQMSEKHRERLRHMYARKKWSFGTVFRRVRKGKSMAELRTDSIAGCLRTPRGGSGRQILIVAGFGRVRARLLTPRECARLMGADDFTINVPLNQALFGFGDAVCVPVVTWIASNYVDPLLEEIRFALKPNNKGIQYKYAIAR
jgi:DNA (cytosine-5)-methyltransferase 1